MNYLASEMIAGEQLSQQQVGFNLALETQFNTNGFSAYDQQEAAPPTDLDAMSRYAELEALDRAQKQLGDTAPSTGSFEHF